MERSGGEAISLIQSAVTPWAARCTTRPRPCAVARGSSQRLELELRGAPEVARTRFDELHAELGSFSDYNEQVTRLSRRRGPPGRAGRARPERRRSWRKRGQAPQRENFLYLMRFGIVLSMPSRRFLSSS